MASDFPARHLILAIAACLAGHNGGLSEIAIRSKNNPRPILAAGEQVPAKVLEDESEFDSNAAFQWLNDVCDIGPRPSGSEGMIKQRKMLAEHIESCQGQVLEHKFSANNPATGQPVQMINLIGRWFPERKKRLLLCCHYDTRPFPDRDPVDPNGIFLGANDGASGVAILAELMKHFSKMEGKFGIDVIFFDGEELVYVKQRDPMFIGSTEFANAYANRRWDVKYDYGILIDMVGDSNLQIYFEKNSLNMAPRLTRSIWSVAKDMGVDEFIPRAKHEIRDDHLPINNIARIPTCDIIDFDFPDEDSDNAYWHTTKDIPENCSADSLGKVGSVLLEWTRRLQDPGRK